MASLVRRLKPTVNDMSSLRDFSTDIISLFLITYEMKNIRSCFIFISNNLLRHPFVKIFPAFVKNLRLIEQIGKKIVY